jgi:large repetitive protein
MDVTMRSQSTISRFFTMLRLFTVLGMIVGLFAPLAQTTYAASVVGATYSGTTGIVTVGGMLYARQGAALMLNITTDATTSCVRVSDGTNTVERNTGSTNVSNGKSWVFKASDSYLSSSAGAAAALFTAGAGDGLKSVTVTAFKNDNNKNCIANANESFGTQTASYTLDNSGPVVTALVSPPANSAGWHNSNLSVSWTAADAGSGFVSTPTFAPTSVSTSGTSSVTSSTVQDRLGHTGSGSVTVKLDKSAPTIAGSRTPAPNANGWNNSDVAVSFACADQSGLSGIKSCTNATTTLTNNGANQSVTGTAVDHADNTASTTVSGINIDKVAPSLSGVPTTAANAAGWYKGDVVIDWTGSDALSGIAADPPDSTISGEGSSLTASSSVNDKAGNTANALSPAVKIDRTAPNTTVTAPPAWNNSDLTLSLNADDALSGVKTTFYKLNGSAEQAGSSVAINSEGVHTLQFWSVDNAGNVEAARTAQVKIDKSAPTISHTQSPAANGNGWNNSSVTVTFNCNDSLSGIASCTAPQTITSEGKQQPVTGTARDHAGNTATDPATVSIDKSAPAISASRTPAPNANGWNNTPVTVGFTCADTLSGTDLCPSAQTRSEGANQSVSGSTIDAAGNTASATISGINVDLSDPTLSGTPTTAPNVNGWYNADVTVDWSAADALSGLAGTAPADSTISGEGANLSAAQTVSDKAGNQATKTVGGIKIDRTQPSTSAVAPLGWQSSDVTVSFEASDNLSGVNATYYKLNGGAQQSGNAVTIGSDGVHTIQYASIDDAGNAEAWKSVTVKLDKQSPTITADQMPPANSNGWNNSSVTVSFACADQDALSGLASCAGPQTVTTEGKQQPVVGAASDHAGNSAQAPTTVSIDKTAPTISVKADRAANANGWYSDDVTVSFACADSLSGIDTCAGPQTLAEGGNQSASGSAIDAAGNSASTTISGINVDKTAPTLGAAPTTLPNADGWYKSDVTMTWSCGDHLSGVAGSCPPDSVIGGEGDDLHTSALISDNAGNTATADSPTVKIDRNAPSTDVAAPSEWVNSSVTVELSANDALSGVKATYYSLNGGAQQSASSLTISSEGIHTLKFWSVDKAGNAETPKTAQIKVDRSAPTIDHTQSPPANANGWNNSSVTVTFACNDADSGIKSCTAPQTVTTEGKDQIVSGTAEDNAGNKQNDQASVSIDKSAPTISAKADRAANANGWYSDDVTVKFTCADNASGSGIDECAATQTLAEGGNQSASGSAIDAAGNSASTTVSGINVDKTAPSLSGKPGTAANSDGWYNGSVTIVWTCADALSGIDGGCPGSSTIAGEGENLSASASVKDKAGNVTNADSPAIKLDRSAPSTGANAPSGWNNNNVTVSLDAFDALSGVKATYYKLNGGAQQSGSSVAINSEGVHSVQFWSVDRAGNNEAAQTITVKIDKTAPQVSANQSPAANGNGWNNSDVKVTFACNDTLSGVKSCTAPETVTTEGKQQPVTGTAVDHAGNSTTELANVSIDKSAPTIVGTSSPAANSFGWNNSDVTVSFACDDALSGIDICPAAKTLAEGGNQSASGSAIDVAGNSASTTISGINVDKTAPTLSGAATSEANAAGWYNGDVLIRWQAADALSGIDPATQPADSTISSEGTNLTASALVSDRAGNDKSATSPAIKVDRSAPSTKVSAPSDWVNNSVTLSLDADDNLSGVKATYYKLNGGAQQSGSSLTISSEGVHSVQFWSVDNADNVENVKTAQVKIDLSNPTISHTQSPAANELGWNNSNVTVTFLCNDTNGIASCTAPQTVTTEGKDQPVTGKAVDVAGNIALDPALVSIDKSAPALSAGLSANANANGWYNNDVTLSFTCADSLSGVYSCPAAKTFGEGANQGASGQATDAAGNLSAAAGYTGINVDKTRPTLSGAATTAPNANGWYNGNVTIAWAAADALSGINPATVPAATTLSGEGDALSASASVSDKADNSASATVGGIKIDRSAPSTSATAPTSWQKANFSVSFSAGDALSGVQATYYSVNGGAQQSGSSAAISTDGSHTVKFWSVDKAGNAEVPQTITVKLDKQFPTISGAATTAPNASGWYSGPVTIRFTCSDALSGIANCPADVTLTADGASQSASGTATDNAGNTATATVTVNLDSTRPTITINGVADKAVYTLGAVPAASCTATDATSGLDGACKVTVSGGTANGVGTFTYTATAKDKAGNVATTQTGSYRVIYRFDGFLQPINDTAHQVGTSTSIFKGGSTVPVKFQLKKVDGTLVQTAAVPQWLNPARGSSTAAAVDESAYSDPASSGSGYRWDATAQQYIYNWSTRGQTFGYYYRIGVALDDGQIYYVNIGLR